MPIPFVFCLILLTAPNGAIIGHYEGEAANMDDCHTLIAKTLADNPPASGITPHSLCINMTPLPTDTAVRALPEPAFKL